MSGERCPVCGFSVWWCTCASKKAPGTLDPEKLRYAYALVDVGGDKGLAKTLLQIRDLPETRP